MYPYAPELYVLGVEVILFVLLSEYRRHNNHNKGRNAVIYNGKNP